MEYREHRQRDLRFNIIVAVWGDEYVSCLCDIALPSLVLTDERSDLARACAWKFLVYAPSADHARLAGCIERLFPLADRSLIDFDPDAYPNAHVAMSHAHHMAALVTIEDRARAIVLPPDAVFSQGSLEHIARISAQGKRALMTTGPRIRQLDSYEPLKTKLASGASLSGRALAAFLMKNVHAGWHRYHWSSTNFSTKPFALMWDAPNGWLTRNFHLHPLMIDLSMPKALAYLQSDTIDGEFVGRAIGNWDDIHVVQDSDDLLMCTLTPENARYDSDSMETGNVPAIRWAAYEAANVNALHRWYVTKAIRIHAGDLDQNWREIEEETGHLIFDVLSQHRDAVPDIVAPPPEPDPPPAAPEPAIVTYEALAGNTTPTPGRDQYNNVLEDNVRISSGTQMQGQCFVGRGTELNDVTLYPATKVGRYCSIARNAAVGASNHPISGLTSSLRLPAISAATTFPGVELGHDVWVGANATILSGVKVGHGAVIGAGAIVTKDVRPYAIVIGLPAREIRRRFPDAVCDALVASCWWELPYTEVTSLPAMDMVETLGRLLAWRVAEGCDPDVRSCLEKGLNALAPAPTVLDQEVQLETGVQERSVDPLTEAREQTTAVEIVLGAVLRSMRPWSLNRSKFLRLVAEASKATPDEGPQAARHDVMLREARRVLKAHG